MVKIFRLSNWHADSPSFVFTSERTGMNAWDNAPSANSLRSRFGIRKATKKASVWEEAPK